MTREAAKKQMHHVIPVKTGIQSFVCVRIDYFLDTNKETQ